MEKKQIINRNEAKLLGSWMEAALDLQIEVIPNFKLHTSEGKTIDFLLLVKGFGSSKGTLILTLENLNEFDTPEKYGYYCSALNFKSYGKYHRDRFIDTLEDWRYFGEPKLKPEWYCGVYEE